MLKDRQRGSSVVFAIVAMTFVSLLGLAVVALTVSNIQMKQSEKESQANFYDVDSIMDEAMAGVQNMSDIASSDAYSSTLSSYTSVLSGVSTSLQEKYEKAFIANMVKILSDGNETFSDGTSSYHYYDDVIRKYFSGTNRDCYRSHADGKGTLKYEDGVLVLKELEVESTTNNYTSHLKTDIRVDIPPLTSETHSEYLDYALIADNQIKADIGGGAKAGVEGSIYSGTVYRDSMTNDPEAGIIIGAGTELDIKAHDLISRGDILVKGGSTFNATGTSEGLKLWVENILTKADGSSAGNTISLNGEINVADDLELNSENDNVKITGSYEGFNYNSTYDSANISRVSADSKMSSAILINGRKCTLNMEDVLKLVLAGRTFISRNSNSEVYDYDPSKSVTNKDIMMGESLSVKGAQLSYYVPGDFVSEESVDPAITYPYELDGKIYFQYSDEPSKAYVFNYEGYNDYINAAGFDVRTYIDSNTPLTYYYRNDPDIKPISYYYLNFSSKEKASKFYEVFSNSSPRNNSLKDVNKEFMSGPGITLHDGNFVFVRSGNVLCKNPAGDLSVRLTNESLSVDDQLQLYTPGKARQYMSKQMALLDEYDVVNTGNVYRLLSVEEAEKSEDTKQFSKSGYVDGDKETNMFDKLVDRTKLAAKGDFSHEEDGLIVRIVSGDITWDSAAKSLLNGKDTGIIIATGNVELKEDFHGMIIAGGDISFASSNVKIYSAPDKVAELFKKDKSAATPMFVDMFTTYFRTVVDTSLGSSTGTDTDNVTYENWDRK